MTGISLQRNKEGSGYEYLVKDTAHPKTALHFHLSGLPDENTEKIVNALAVEIFEYSQSLGTPDFHISLTSEELREANKDTSAWVKNRCETILKKVFERSLPLVKSKKITKAPSVPIITQQQPLSINKDLFKLKKRVAHTNGDLFIEASGLESADTLDMMRFFRDCLQEKLKNEPKLTHASGLEKLLESINAGIALQEKFHLKNPSEKELDAAVEQVQSTLKKLTPDKNIVLDLGWTGTGSNEDRGHALYCEISRNANGMFRVTKFNKGAGVEYHPGVKVLAPDAPERTPKIFEKYLGRQTRDNVSEERMLSAAFWRPALEMNSCPNIPESTESATENDQKAKFNSGDLEKLFSFLQGTVVEEQNLTLTDYSILQNSGICAWAGLEELLKKHLTPNEAAKYLFEISLKSLEDLYQAYKEPKLLSTDEQARSLLRKSAIHCAALATQYYESNIISLDEFDKAINLAAKVRKHVEMAEQVLEKERNEKANAQKFVLEPVKQDVYGKLPDLSTTNLESQRTSHPASTTLFWDPDWNPEPKSIVKDLKNFLERCEKLKSKEPQMVVWFIRELMVSLPMPLIKEDPFWSSKEISDADAETCMRYIGALSELSAKLCEETNADTQPDKRYDLIICHYKGLIIQHKLACRFKEMAEFDIERWNLDDELRKLFHFDSEGDPCPVYDSQMSSQLIQVERYIETLNALATDIKNISYFEPSTYSDGRRAAPGLPIEERGNPREMIESLAYYKAHKDKFEKCYGKEFNAIESQLSKGPYFEPDIAKATFALKDFEGTFFPQPYYLLKRQAFLAHYFLRGEEITFKAYHDPKRNNVFISTTLRKDIVKTTDDQWTLPETPFSNICSKWLISNRTKQLLQRGWTELRSLPTGISTECHFLPQELQIIKTLDAFDIDSDNSTKALHFERLGNPELYHFLRELLFSRDYLLTCLEKCPETAQRFLDFVMKGYEYFYARNKLSDAVHMINLGQMLKDRLRLLPEVKNCVLALEQFKKEFNTEDLLNNLLKEAKSNEDKIAIYRSLIFEYDINWNPKLIHEKYIEIASALAYLEASSIDRDFLTYVVDRLKIRFTPILKQIFSGHRLSNVNCMQTIAKTFGLQSEIANLIWTWKPPLMTGSKSSGEEVAIFNAETFSFSYLGKNAVFLPASITSHADFKRNFPNLERCVARTDGKGNYEFSDKDCLVRIRASSDGSITIQRQFQKNGPWFQYDSGKIFENVIASKILKEEKTFWIACDKSKTLLCKPGSAITTHAIIPRPNRGFDIIDLHYLHRILANINNLPQHIKELFSRFELNDYTHLWINAKSGEPESIEMPRLGLTFDVESGISGNLRVKSKQVTGFYIAERQYVKALGSFKNYLVLENDKGQKKVVIPLKKLDIKETGGLTTEIFLQKDFPKNYKFPPFLEYTINANGELESSHEMANLGLAYIYAGQRRYKEAQQLLRVKSRKNKRFCKSELEMLTWIHFLFKSIGENDPKSNTVYLTMCALRWKNISVYDNEPANFNVHDRRNFYNELKKCYEKYLSLQEYMGDLLLTQQEELVIVKRLARCFPEDDFIQTRLRILSEPPTAVMAPSITPLTASTVSSWYLTPESITNEFKVWFGFSSSRKFMTRPQSKLVRVREYFNEQYKFIKSLKTENNRELAMKYEMLRKFHDKNIFAVLAGIALKPNEFPEDLEKFFKEKESKVIEKMYERAIKIYEEFNKTPSEADKKEQFLVLPKREFDKKIAVANAIDVKEAVEKSYSLSNKVEHLFETPPSSHDILADLFTKLPADQAKQKIAAQLISEMEQKRVVADSGTGEKIHKDLITDIKAYGNQVENPTYQFKFSDRESALKDLETSYNLLEIRRIASTGRTEELKERLLEVANRSFPNGIQTREDSVKYRAELESTQKQPITTELLSILFLRNNPALLKQHNRLLTDADIATLRSLLTAYLVRVTDEQKLTRQALALNAIADHIRNQPQAHNYKTDSTLEELSQKAAQEFTSERAYDPQKDYMFLVYEAFSEIMIRSDQVSNIRKLANADYMILQMIMGSGKSKVLLPILAMLRADGEHLSVVILPTALYESTMNELRQGAWKIFEKMIHTRPVNRDTDFSEERLSELLSDLEMMRKNGEPLVMTNKSIACLLLKYKEMLKDYSEKPDKPGLRQKLHLMQSILKLFKTKGKAIIDESDIILNTKLEINFTVGKAKNLDPSRSNLIIALYEQLRSPEVRKIIGSDPLDSYTVPPEQFSKEIKPILIEKMLQTLPLSTYLKDLDIAKVKSFLSGIKNEEIKKYIEGLKDLTCRDLLALLKEELNTLLPLTLSKRCSVDYGPSLRKPKDDEPCRSIAIPYSGNNTPVESSEFRSTDAILNYTVQSCWKNGVMTADVLAALKDLSADAALQKEYKLTKAYKRFLELCGNISINLFDPSATEIERFRDHLNEYRKSNPQLFFGFVNEYILSKIKSYPEQISSTAIELTGLFKSIIGFTGTPWNDVTQREVLNKATERAEGTDGKTAVVLFEKVDGKIDCLKDATYPAVIEKLIHLEDDALIDTGAIFSGKSNQEVAERMLQHLQKLGSHKIGVVFFQKNKQMIIEAIKDKDGKEIIGTRIIPLADSALKPEERYVYYDQPHTTGTDIPLPALCKAKQTIGKDDKTRDWFQGAWRERKLDKKQQISLVVLPEAREKMGKMFGLHANAPIAFKHVLQFTNANQEQQLLAQLAISVKQKIDFVVRKIDPLLEIDFKEEKVQPENVKLIKELLPILVTKQNTAPYDLYERQEIPPGDIRGQKMEAEKLLKAMSPICALFKGDQKIFIENIMKQIDAELGEIEKLLPKVPQINIGKNEGEVEQQKVADREVDTERVLSSMDYKDTLISKKSWVGDPNLFSKEFYSSPRSVKAREADNKAESSKKEFSSKKTSSDVPPKIFEVAKVLSETAEMSDVASLSKDIIASENRFEPLKKDKPELCVHKSVLLPMQYFLFVCDKKSGELKLQMLDPTTDLCFFWEALSQDRMSLYPVKGKREMEVCLCNSSGVVIQHGSEMSDAFRKEIERKGMDLRVRAKLLSGQLNFAPNETEYVQSLTKEHGNAIEKYLQRYVLEDDQMKLLSFKKSQLFRLLGEPVWVNEMITAKLASTK